MIGGMRLGLWRDKGLGVDPKNGEYGGWYFGRFKGDLVRWMREGERYISKDGGFLLY